MRGPPCTGPFPSHSPVCSCRRGQGRTPRFLCSDPQSTAGSPLPGSAVFWGCTQGGGHLAGSQTVPTARTLEGHALMRAGSQDAGGSGGSRVPCSLQGHRGSRDTSCRRPPPAQDPQLQGPRLARPDPGPPTQSRARGPGATRHPEAGARDGACGPRPRVTFPRLLGRAGALHGAHRAPPGRGRRLAVAGGSGDSRRAATPKSTGN